MLSSRASAILNSISIDTPKTRYDVGQIARAMDSDINLVALKVAELNRQGYSFRSQEFRSDFLK